MTLTPPDPAQPGQPYILSFQALGFEGGSPVEPLSVQLDLTYGSYVQLAPDVAGPFIYAGDTPATAGPGVLWRTGTGAYSFQWNIPADALPGVYVANWTWVYGPDGDTFLAAENFVITGGGPFLPVPSGDTGYWTGSITYQPSWAPAPFTIPLGGTDSDGVTWLLKSVTGWDGPPTVGQVIQRSADHGGWASAQYYGPRQLTLDVLASAPTQALRDDAKQRLVQACPVSDLAVFTYNEPTPKLAYVRQNGSANIAMTYPTLCDVEFTIPLVCPDPRKYATVPLVQTATLPAPVVNPLTLPVVLPIGFPGSAPPIDSAITCTNSGTFETRPVITIGGPLTSPQIINANTAQAITFTGLTLAASDQLVIDTDARQAYLGGVYQPADIDSAWFVLEPGDTQIYLTGQNFSGGGTISVQFSSAWA